MSKKITVGCKLPNGLVLNVNGTEVTINGFMKGSNIIGGYGITENVDEELFDAWIKNHSEMQIVKNELIFKAKSLSNAKAQAEDTKDKKSGLERVDPKKEPDLEKLEKN